MMAAPLEIERKYLIERPSEEVLHSLPEASATQITQTYLTMQEDGFGRRVRKRGSEAGGWEYTYTRKHRIGFGKRIELEDTITQAQYEALLQEADPALHTIEKVRWCFTDRGQHFELDVYAFSQTLATLESELPDIDTPVQLPEMLHILRDVTDRKGYSNLALSKTLAFPGQRE